MSITDMKRNLCCSAILMLTTASAIACQNSRLGTRPSLSQTPLQAVVVDIIGYKAEINSQVAAKQDSVELGDRVSTTQARAELKFDDGAVSRLGQNAVLLVGKDCAQISQGRILVSGKMGVCTESVIASVQGTTYSVEIYPEGGGHVGVFEGTVVLSSTIDPNLESLILTSGQGVDFTEAGTFENFVDMPQSVFEGAMTGELVAEFAPLPSEAALRESFARLYPEAEFPQ